jgi:hypothetical protein
MDSAFTAYCEGVGLALAAGLLAGAVSGAIGPGSRRTLAALGAIAGAVLFYLSLNSSDHAAWPGPILGTVIAVPGFLVACGVVIGASSRAGSSPPAVAAMVVVFALVVAGLSLVIAPISLFFLAVVVALLTTRRRRESRKHEGLRVLR